TTTVRMPRPAKASQTPPPPTYSPPFPTRRSSDLSDTARPGGVHGGAGLLARWQERRSLPLERIGVEPEADEPALSEIQARSEMRSEEHTSELQSRSDLVCRLLLEK